ncbi:transcriptional activator of ethanol catabolism AlcS [Penicillium canariense]|uniref:Transcriptional activator of ethanol catabolism AlcS n=1 Tax=Penicillium canariense TaxID=189055 RepID=A0A9W9I523_9EURO|nr:transcriptional activator of ethanol catabolism AlcS [Penicillium canariense]KAJ5168030.1 transcriptional activator of ethanol catabolism AlcS [Penicillium canariense]
MVRTLPTARYSSFVTNERAHFSILRAVYGSSMLHLPHLQHPHERLLRGNISYPYARILFPCWLIMASGEWECKLSQVAKEGQCLALNCELHPTVITHASNVDFPFTLPVGDLSQVIRGASDRKTKEV